MCLAGQLLEHLLRLGRVGGLTEDQPLQHDLRVDAEHRPLTGLVRDAARLPLRMLAHDFHRVCDLGCMFLVPRLDQVERNAELFENRATLWRA